MAPHSITLAWKTPWTEELGRLQSMGLLESDTTERLHFHFSLSCIGEGNGNPLQCSCLENPRDGGAWWAAVYGVAQSRTQLKRLSSSSSRSLLTGFYVIVFSLNFRNLGKKVPEDWPQQSRLESNSWCSSAFAPLFGPEVLREGRGWFKTKRTCQLKRYTM